MTEDYLSSAKKQFAYYKSLGEKTFEQLNDEQLCYVCNSESNSIAMIVQHLSGNMLSRWTDFFTTDGEKDWRNRDTEFEPQTMDRAMLMKRWDRGWDCLFKALDALKVEDLEREIYIRNQGHTVLEVINRQLAHYPYHIGQIVFLGKMLLAHEWHTLSIPKGKSIDYNTEKFAQEKRKQHFTEESL